MFEFGRRSSFGGNALSAHDFHLPARRGGIAITDSMSTLARDLLSQYLGQLQARGVTHVMVDRAVLGKVAKEESVAEKPAAQTSTPTARAASAPAITAAPVREAVRPNAPVAEARPQPAAAPSEAGAKAAQLDVVKEKAVQAEAPRKLGTFRDIMVFAVGNPEAELMFIGEAPGAEEERQREPFVGPAGQLLTKIINAMGVKRGDVYISNICKFRPVVNDGKPQNNRNRPPTREEMDACLPFIMEEIQIIQPRVIVALGATAANGLGVEGTVGRLRGAMREFKGTPLMVTYHPSYLLRREEEDGGGLREKRLVWEDMLQVMEHLGLPISEKQQRYFTKAIG